MFAAPEAVALRRFPLVSSHHPQAEICRQCPVRSGSLFGVLDDSGLARIRYPIEDVRLKAGEPLFEADVTAPAVYTVKTGVVMQERLSVQGERRILRLSGPSDLVGQEAVLGQMYTARAVALTDVSACRIPVAMVQELLNTEAAMCRDLMLRWQQALDEANEWLAELSTGTARDRVLRLFLKFTDYYGGDLVQLPLRDDIGAMLGITLETASRTISQLRREGLISAPQSNGQVRIDVAAVLRALKPGLPANDPTQTKAA